MSHRRPLLNTKKWRNGAPFFFMLFRSLLASHAGVFRGARFSSLPTRRRDEKRVPLKCLHGGLVPYLINKDLFIAAQCSMSSLQGVPKVRFSNFMSENF